MKPMKRNMYICIFKYGGLWQRIYEMKYMGLPLQCVEYTK